MAGLGIAAGLTLTCMNPASAGPLDSRVAQCVLNKGEYSRKTRTDYLGYYPVAYQIRLAFSPDFIVPSHPVRGQILSFRDAPMPYLEGGTTGEGVPLLRCPKGTIETFHGNGTLVPGMRDVYKTDVPGIGYRVYYYISDQGHAAAPASFSNEFNLGVLIYPMNTSRDNNNTNVRTRIEFVATGDPIQPGTIYKSQVYGEGNRPEGVGFLPYSVRMLNDITVAQPTCSIRNQAALDVKLPTISTQLLKASGAGDPVPVSLQVNCTMASYEAPTISMTTSHLALEVPGTLANQDTSATGAQGVGVQVQYEMPSGTLVPFQPGVATRNVGVPAGSPPTQDWLFRLVARFVQLGSASDVKPGHVHATGTLTFTYS